MRGPGATIATLILMLAIAAGAFALPKGPELGRMAADGPVTLSSTRAGSALLHGENIMPGDSVTGLVTLSNKGDRPGKLALTLDGLRDTPGLYGGRLSSVLRLRIDDLTSGGAPIDTTLSRAHAAAARRPQGPPGPHLQGDCDLPRHWRPRRSWAGRQRPAGLERRGRDDLASDPVRPGQAAARPGASRPAPSPSPPRPGAVPERPAADARHAARARPARHQAAQAEGVRVLRAQVQAEVQRQDRQRAEARQEGQKAKKRRVIMGSKVIKKNSKKWFPLKRVGTEKRYYLKLTKKALRKLKSSCTARAASASPSRSRCARSPATAPSGAASSCGPTRRASGPSPHRCADGQAACAPVRGNPLWTWRAHRRHPRWRGQ